MAGLPYTGCDVVATAVAMNKAMCKALLQNSGIPVLPSIVVRREQALADLSAVRNTILAAEGLGSYPLFVKPNHLGSSVGIGKATDDASLDAALAKVFRYDQEAIIEPCVEQLLEINISVLEDDQPFTSVTETPVSDSGTLSYEEKYLRGGGKKGGRSGGMASLTRVVDPPDLDDMYKKAVQAHALKAFQVLGCGGLVRFDFIVDLATGNLYFNELNPIPGSFSFYLWDKSKPPRLYTENIDLLIRRALLRKQRKDELSRSIGLKALMRD
jgi:D-alanine-D-alanine ligase